MLLKYFYDDALAHASYLVGCQQTGEAIVVDPGRDIDRYLMAARQEGMRIVGIAETHIHADYVSGARELADRVGAKLFVSDCGPAEWKYEYVQQYAHQKLKDGDKFGIGKVEFEVLFTPGHTPESISFLLTDRGGGASQPIGIFTGDFVFVGSIGRPDLLEQAAGVVGSADVGARQLFSSIERFKQLPDYLQIWPAHGAGSACGKGLGAIPSSTVGYEKLFNPALQFSDEQEFVDYILSEQPEAPKYFALMKRVNKEGPTVLGPAAGPPQLPIEQVSQLGEDRQILDTSPLSRFANEHVPGTVNIPTALLGHWAGWLVDYRQPLYLISSRHEVAEAVRVLHKMGVEDIRGWFDVEQVANEGLDSESFPSARPNDLVAKIKNREVELIDVRSQAEWDEGHIPEASHFFLGRLPDELSRLERDKPIAIQCRSGGRSRIAASVLQANGFKDVIDLAGGIQAWIAADFPVESSKDAEQAAV